MGALPLYFEHRRNFHNTRDCNKFHIIIPLHVTLSRCSMANMHASCLPDGWNGWKGYMTSSVVKVSAISLLT